MTNNKEIMYGPEEDQEQPKVEESIDEGLPGQDDMVFEEDFTNDESTTGYHVQKGFYHAILIDMEKGMSQAGNPQYIWQFKLLSGEGKGREFRYWTSLLPQARWKVIETLEALGVKAQGSIAKFKRSDVVGKPCILLLEDDTYEGQTTSKIQRVMRPNESTLGLVEKMSKDVPF